MRDDECGIDPAWGLHNLIGQPDQLAYLGRRCACILAHLGTLIPNTAEQAPLRDENFCLDRTADGPASQLEEARWERAMWRRWGPHGRGEPFLPSCPRIQTYQFPLKRVRADALWGKVDLLGVSPNGLPVVVELKKGRTTDTVLRMLLEMAAYGIALRKAWSLPRAQSTLKPDWEEAMRNVGRPVDAPEHLDRVSLIGIAPQPYWDRALGRAHKERAGRVPREAWPVFCRLVDELSSRCNFDISFAVVDAAEQEVPGGGAGLELATQLEATAARPFVLCPEGGR